MHIPAPAETKEHLIIIQDGRDIASLPLDPPSYGNPPTAAPQTPQSSEASLNEDEEQQTTPPSPYPLLIQQYALLCSNSLPSVDAAFADLVAEDLADSTETSFSLYEAILRHWLPDFSIARYLPVPYGASTLDLAVTRRHTHGCTLPEHADRLSNPFSTYRDETFPEGEPVAFVKLFEPETFDSDMVRAESLALTLDAHAEIAPYLPSPPSGKGCTLVVCAFGRRWRARLMSTMLSGDLMEIMPDSEDDTGWMDDIVSEASYEVMERLVRRLLARQCCPCRRGDDALF
ncbi:hypothetical protein K523DRAFT_295542 [Schizophyllum commune Tattone D]|nr:hypothetical protein K523DRAFT_295542 [Schizophyllum commune Tattone D]